MANDGRQLIIEAENNDKLWEVFNIYLDDEEGVTKREAIELAEFTMEPGRTTEAVFERCKKVCKSRAESRGWTIPRPTYKRGRGPAYVLSTGARTAWDGFALQSRINRGVAKSTAKAAEFIDRDQENLPPVVRTAYQEMRKLDRRYAEQLESERMASQEMLDAMVAAHKEEQAQKAAELSESK